MDLRNFLTVLILLYLAPDHRILNKAEKKKIRKLLETQNSETLDEILLAIDKNLEAVKKARMK